MDEHLHHIEDLFKNALNDNKQAPDSKVWDAIEHKLDKDDARRFIVKYRNLKKVLLLVLLVFSGLLYLLWNKYETSSGNRTMQHETTEGNSVLVRKDEAKKTIGSDKEKVENNVAVPAQSDADTAKQQQPIAATNEADKTSVGKLEAQQKQTTTVTNEPPTAKPGNEKSKSPEMVKLAYNKTNIVSHLKTENTSLPPEHINMPQADNVLKTFAPAPVLLTNNASINRRSSFSEQGLMSSFSLNNVKWLKRSSSLSSAAMMKPKKQSRFGLSLFFSPDFDYYHLEDDDHHRRRDDDDAQETEKNESHQFSSTAGLLLNYHVRNKWNLQSGLTFSNINITQEPKIIYARADNAGQVKYQLSTSAGYVDVSPSFSGNPALGDSLYVATSTHTLHYIGVPVMVKYNESKGRWNFNAGAGVSVNILASGKIKTEIEQGTNKEAQVITHLQGLKDVYLSGLLSAGASYSLSKKIALSLDPTWRFPLNDINKEAAVKSYPYSFGLAFGVQFRVK